jgi:restriction system protein
MAVPDFQSFFKSLLDVAADGKEHSMKEAREIIAKRMNISDTDLREMLPSGTQTKYDNRVAWAKSYFVQANVFESPKRGWFRITERGKELHKKGHDRIDVKILNQFPEFVEFHTAKPGQETGDVHSETSTVETPEETLQKAYINIRADLAAEILERIKSNSPQFFERLVVDVMVALGYGARGWMQASP